MFGLWSLLLAEPVMCMSIFPYINEVRPLFVISALPRSNEVNCQLVTELLITDGDERKVGYYAGIIVRWVLLQRISCDENVDHLTDIALLFRRGHHRVAVEPTLRLGWSQAYPSRWYPWRNDSDDSIWIVAIILDIGLEVNMPLRVSHRGTFLIQRCKADFLQAR
jgi:hypothetical protein